MPLPTDEAPSGYSQEQQREIREAVARVLEYPVFVASPRLRSFLTFLVDETLAGRAAQLKAYTIATGAFGLPENFDPQSNSIVRVEAKRLRAALDAAYASFTPQPPVIIRLVPGTYVPRFEFGPVSDNSSQEPSDNGTEQPVATLAADARPARRYALAAVLVATVSAAALGVWSYSARRKVHSPPVTDSAAIYGRPLVRVEIRGIGDTAEEAVRFETALENALARFRAMTVRADGAASGPPGMFDYVVAGDIEPDRSISLRLLRAQSSEIVWAERYVRPPDDTTVSDARLVDEVASRLAQRYGLIQSDLRRRIVQSPTPLAGYGCILMAEMQFARPTPDTHRLAEECLRSEIARLPNFADARATYARLLLQDWRTGGALAGDLTLLDRAAALADEAVAQEPHSARSHFARFLVRFDEQRYVDAFESAETALKLNPNSTDIAASIGAARILRADFEQGRALLNRASRFSESLPGWYDIYYFIEAYMREDFVAAERRAARRTLVRFPLGLVAKMLIATRNGNQEQLARWSARLKETYPLFANDLERALTVQGMHETIRGRILEDLRQRS
jgi:tetratricopeptide (TPR) repeat protein